MRRAWVFLICEPRRSRGSSKLMLRSTLQSALSATALVLFSRGLEWPKRHALFGILTRRRAVDSARLDSDQSVPGDFFQEDSVYDTMPKRKNPSQHEDESLLRRSTRQRTTVASPTADTKPTKSASGGSGKSRAAKAEDPEILKKKTKVKQQQEEKPEAEAKSTSGTKAKKSSPASASAAKAKSGPNKAEGSAKGSSGTGRQYWLMKAEPESRIEKGVDVRFSIDDLASKTEPEPWDGESTLHSLAVRFAHLIYRYQEFRGYVSSCSKSVISFLKLGTVG